MRFPKNFLCALAPLLLLPGSAPAESPFPVSPAWAVSVLADPSGGGFHFGPGNIPYSYPPWANDVGYLSPDSPVVMEFDHDILDDPLNPYGLDFIVFVSFYGKWRSGALSGNYVDTEDVNAVYDLFEDEWDGSDPWRIRVSVSRNGSDWFPSPTLATRTNTVPVFGMPVARDGSWGPDACDFRWPVDREAYRREILARDGRISVADLSALCRTSAGGIAFDLKEFLSGSAAPTNAAGELAVRFVRLELLDETEKGYVAVAGASDVRPAAFGFRDFSVASATNLIAGFSVTGDVASFSASLPPGASPSGLWLSAKDSLSSEPYRFPMYAVGSSEMPDGSLEIRAVSPLSGRNLQFFRLGQSPD